MDASDTGIGAVLSQVDKKGQEWVIAYGSRLLSKAERQYCVTWRELFTVVFFTRYFRPYLVERSFCLRTDHVSLTWLWNFCDPEGQLEWWLVQLFKHITIDYKLTDKPKRKIPYALRWSKAVMMAGQENTTFILSFNHTGRTEPTYM